MKVKALRSFSGAVNMSRNQVMDIQDEFILNDLLKAGYVEPLEEAIDQITDEIRKRHIRRMQRGGCSIELSWNFNEMLVSLERISDLCSNVAFFTSKAADRHPDRHSYRLELRHKGEFSSLLFEALEKYKLSPDIK